MQDYATNFLHREKKPQAAKHDTKWETDSLRWPTSCVALESIRCSTWRGSKRVKPAKSYATFTRNQTTYQLTPTIMFCCVAAFLSQYEIVFEQILCSACVFFRTFLNIPRVKISHRSGRQSGRQTKWKTKPDPCNKISQRNGRLNGGRETKWETWWEAQSDSCRGKISLKSGRHSRIWLRRTCWLRKTLNAQDLAVLLGSIRGPRHDNTTFTASSSTLCPKLMNSNKKLSFHSFSEYLR